MAARKSEDGLTKVQPAEATGGPTGQELGPPRDLSKVPPHLRAHAHEPGSNGGVKRGPDLKPRGLMPSVLLKAFTDEGEVARAPYTHRSGAQKRKRARAIYAMSVNTAKALQGIALDAAEGDALARSQLLRIIHDGHQMLQPPKDNRKNSNGYGGGPIMPRFSPPLGAPAPAVDAPAPASPRGVVDADGELYEEAD